MPSAEARIFVRNDAPIRLDEGVVAGGGVVVPLEEANAIVWAASDPEELARALHPGIRWVQLSFAGIEDFFAAAVVDDERLWTAAKGVYAGPIAEYALAITRSGCKVPGATESLGPDALGRLLGESDWVLLAVPDTRETRRLISAERLALMRPHAWLINVARGTLVDTDALVEALVTGRIGGAALDVTDPEPLPDGHPLWDLENAIVTSHTAAGGWAMSNAALAERVRENV